MNAHPQTISPDYAAARFHMIESQLRTNKVQDARLLEAMGALPREAFVPTPLSGIAYIDDDIEVAPGRYLLEPMVLARLLQEAAIKASDKALDIAPATGYSTAVLALLARDVTAVEPVSALADSAVQNLARCSIANARVERNPMAAGCTAYAPYDVILINGSVEDVPNILLASLAEGGRLLAVVTSTDGIEPVGEARLYLKARGSVSYRALFNANVKPLAEFMAKPRFVF